MDKSDERLLVDRPSVLAPAIPPTFAAIAARGPVVDIPVSADGGWYYMPPVLQWEWFEQATTDPVVHVVINPPFSGHPTQAEDFLLQIPVTNPVPPAERGLMIGFHGYGLSVAQIFGIAAGVTDLPQYCTDNGWFLLAPTGLTTTSMGSLPSQTALEVILALTVGIFDFSWDKMYTYGFSMGATSATSFALRHQDPYTLRTAAIIHHTGTVDVVRELSDEPAPVLDLWASDTHFGDYFTSDPFAYNRVNPARFDAAGTGFEEEWFTFDGLKHTPFYLHVNANDPSELFGWNAVLRDELAARGFTFKSAVGWTDPPAHTIFSIDYADALGYISQFELGPLPTSSEVFADRPARYLWSKLISDPAPNVARYSVDVNAPGNNFTVDETHHVDELAFDLDLMGIDAGSIVNFTASSGDGTSDTYVLLGYVTAPSQVLVDGGPPFDWSFDSAKGTLSITPNTTGSSSLVQVLP